MKNSRNERKRAQYDIAFPFLLAIILFILLYGAVACVVPKFTRLSDAAEQSYKDMSSEINSAQGQNQLYTKSFSLFLDPDTYVIGYNKDSDFIWEAVTWSGPDQHTIQVISPRPNECREMGSCVCLCQYPKLEPDHSLSCDRTPECTDTGDAVYPVLRQNIEDQYGGGFQLVQHGFIFYRGEVPFTLSHSGISFDERLRVIYIQKGPEYEIRICELNDKDNAAIGCTADISSINQGSQTPTPTPDNPSQGTPSPPSGNPPTSSTPQPSGPSASSTPTP